MFIFEFGIKVTFGTMPNVLLENRFFIEFMYFRSKKNNKTAIKGLLALLCSFFLL